MKKIKQENLRTTAQEFFMYLKSHWVPGKLSTRFYQGFTGRSRRFKKNKRKGL